jgi:hypothetical protein
MDVQMLDAKKDELINLVDLYNSKLDYLNGMKDNLMKLERDVEDYELIIHELKYGT